MMQIPPTGGSWHALGADLGISRFWEVPENSGNNVNLIVKEFLEKEGNKPMYFVDGVNWPGNKNCAYPIKNSST